MSRSRRTDPPVPPSRSSPGLLKLAQLTGVDPADPARYRDCWRQNVGPLHGAEAGVAGSRSRSSRSSRSACGG
ncbi:MAG: hypothetical protein R3F11_31565 [Verrucomicrobiales bacterium]